MTTKHAPATPLPWTSGINGFSQGMPIAVRDASSKSICWLEATGPYMERAVRPSVSPDDLQTAEYIAHAANAYPKLVEALRHLMLRCDGSEGVRADGSNIQTMAASALLAELGEL